MGSFVASWAHEWAAFCPLAAGEQMQRHQFCVATLSRNRAPGLIRRVLSGLFEDGSILATLACGAGLSSRQGALHQNASARCRGSPLAHSDAAQKEEVIKRCGSAHKEETGGKKAGCQ